MTRGLRLLAVLVVMTGLARNVAAQEPSVDAQLAQAKAALARYQDPIAAVFDGYLSTIACVDYPKGGGEGQMAFKPGAMGVHLLNISLIGPKLDPAKPQVLLYEPVGDKLVLTGAEWFLPVMPGVTEPPKVFGQSLQGPMEGHAPFMPPGLHHWDLHVWLWKDNPNGMFHSTNPNVKCPKAAYSFATDVPKMVHTH